MLKKYMLKKRDVNDDLIIEYKKYLVLKSKIRLILHMKNKNNRVLL